MMAVDVVMNPDLTIRAAHKLAVLACKRIGKHLSSHLSCPSPLSASF
jgi:divalent metal cation (Fe/Co/Zn/Cd) transporter